MLFLLTALNFKKKRYFFPPLFTFNKLLPHNKQVFILHVYFILIIDYKYSLKSFFKNPNTPPLQKKPRNDLKNKKRGGGVKIDIPERTHSQSLSSGYFICLQVSFMLQLEFSQAPARSYKNQNKIVLRILSKEKQQNQISRLIFFFSFDKLILLFYTNTFIYRNMSIFIILLREVLHRIKHNFHILS